MTIGETSGRSGWSPRMLRYLEQVGLVVPGRSDAGYRRYGIRELNQLNALSELRARFGVELAELEFALRLRSEPQPPGVPEHALTVVLDVLIQPDAVPAWPVSSPGELCGSPADRGAGLGTEHRTEGHYRRTQAYDFHH